MSRSWRTCCQNLLLLHQLLVQKMLWTGGANAQPASAPRSAQMAAARRAQQLAGATMSPFCPGKTIDACPSPRAGAWRADLRRWTAEGVDSAEIRRRLQARVPGFDHGFANYTSCVRMATSAVFKALRCPKNGSSKVFDIRD